MTLEYASPLYNGHDCRCGAHRLHRVFQFYWSHPSAQQKIAAQMLGIKLGNLKEALWLLRHRDLSKVCPECFRPLLVGGACEGCGFEPFEPVLPVDIMPDSQHPTNSLHPGSMLGSVTDYREVAKAYGFSNQGFVLKRKMDRQIETPLVDAIRSDVANALDGGSRPEIAEEAGRLVLKEVAEFKARYPEMVSSKLARGQLTENVLARLCLLHPSLKVSGLAHGRRES